LLKKTYIHRLEIFCSELTKHLPREIKFKIPDGGYFVWIELPGHMDASAIRKKARHHDVDFLPGVLFSPENNLKNFIRLSFAFYNEPLLIEGAKRLGSLFQNTKNSPRN